MASSDKLTHPRRFNSLWMENKHQNQHPSTNIQMFPSIQLLIYNVKLYMLSYYSNKALDLQDEIYYCKTTIILNSKQNDSLPNRSPARACILGEQHRTPFKLKAHITTRINCFQTLSSVNDTSVADEMETHGRREVKGKINIIY